LRCECEACTVPTVNAAGFDELSEAEKRHFYKFSPCGEMVDKQQVDDLLFHEDHVHRRDIQYAGSQSLRRKIERAALHARLRRATAQRHRKQTMKILIAGIALWALVGCATNSRPMPSDHEEPFQRFSVTRYPYPTAPGHSLIRR
jgi:hypothetical protein